ncbi:hypothetical protein OG897_34410 [Streptomyces sp. NBC_00237]|uniref:hypothetical protein n=1 Tax=Streptomyces sp. NBC_00237 TaxID=2975687 RepID=UPI00225B4496|nr:hypothetical protein [Streptomyces sp. NBC_00237]MCX5206487.1 hypothetical protein [Streptomyces sp. NBC_00237]
MPSGQLVVMGCSDYFPDAPRFSGPAGWIRVRASRRNPAATVDADIDSDESPENPENPENMEQVRLQPWPAVHQAHSALRVLQRWEPAGRWRSLPPAPRKVLADSGGLWLCSRR